MKDRVYKSELCELKKNGASHGLFTYKQMATDANLGLNTTMRLAKESGALVKIGGISRVDPEIFYSYILNNYRVTEGG